VAHGDAKGAAEDGRDVEEGEFVVGQAVGGDDEDGDGGVVGLQMR
jgi:hypothetical protein